MGVIAAVVGVAMIVMSLFGKEIPATLICPKCEAVKPHAEVTDEVCPVCGAKMEPLKGFYERHPERKDKE